MVHFIVDEGSIDLNGLGHEAGLEVVVTLLERIEDAILNGHGVCYDDELFTIPVFINRTLWELSDLESTLHLPPEVSQRMAAVFGTMPRWYEINGPEPTDYDVKVDDGAIETTASVAWAHQRSIRPGGLKSAACICALGRRRSGVVAVEVAGQRREVWFVANSLDMEGYFRWLIAKYATRPDEIAELAPWAFTQFVFAGRCFDGIGRMSKPCRQLAPTIVIHLSAFSDHGLRIFSGPWTKVPAEFGALGVDISDESGNTKSNSQARKERRLIFDGEELFFWWHSKIQRDMDRIYIYPGKVAAGGRIVVGIFSEHLLV
jgi:hypothetical protein